MLKPTKVIQLAFASVFFLLAACTSQQQNQNEIADTVDAHNPKAANINLQLGIGYLQQGDIDRAKQKLLLAEKQDPSSPLVWDSLAYFYSKTGDVNKADQFYRKAISLAPSNGKTLNNYGTFLCGQGQYQKAIQYFNAAVKDPSYVTTGQAYENAGLCAEQIPDRQRAKTLFTKALQNDPTLPTANLEMANISFDEKQYSQAMLYMARYKANAKPNAESLWLDIRLANMAGDQNTVASDVLLLKEKYPLSKEYKQFTQSGINI